MSNSYEIESLLSKLPDFPSQENGDLLDKSSPEIMQLLLEYAKLAALPHLSEQEADRLESILAIAESDELLSFWIDEIDHILNHRLNLLSDNDRKAYQDQQALLRDYIGVMENFPIPKDKQITNYRDPLNPNLLPDDELVHP